MNEHQALREQTYGAHSHLHILHALEGLGARRAGLQVGRAPHTIFEILHHMIYWQDISLRRLHGEVVESPPSASLGWPERPAPEDESDWEATVASFAEGLRDLEALLADEGFDLDRETDARLGNNARQEVLMAQTHNSYHLGQIVSLRQELDSWPPPRGGDTW